MRNRFTNRLIQTTSTPYLVMATTSQTQKKEHKKRLLPSNLFRTKSNNPTYLTFITCASSIFNVLTTAL